MICILDADVSHFYEDTSIGRSSDAFQKIMRTQGQIYRELEGRRTQRITIGEKHFFLKQHFGIGWREIFKNLFQGRLPVLGAKNEWKAIQRLEKLGVQTLQIAAYGEQGINPARLQSFLMTYELPPTTSLEDFCRDWKINSPPFALKQHLLKQVALIAKTLHENGMNHRDFYICHFLLSESQTLYLIDLHRAQIRQKVPMRWIIKDLAGLFFSSKDIGLTQRDLLRFMKYYRAMPLRNILNNENSFWSKVEKRGNNLYQKHAKKSQRKTI